MKRKGDKKMSEEIIMKIIKLVGVIGAGLIPIVIFVPILGVLLGVFPQAEIENIQLLFGIFPLDLCL